MQSHSHSKAGQSQTKFPIVLVGALVGLLVLGLFWFVRAKRAAAQSTAVQVASFLPKDEPVGEFMTKAYLDLTPFANGSPLTNWLGGGKSNNRTLSMLPLGINFFDGVPFNVRNLIQLRGEPSNPNTAGYPMSVKGIPVGRKCTKLHFLHATAWTAPEGGQIAAYIVHYADGSRLEIPVRYGVDLCDWCSDPWRVDNTNGMAWSYQVGVLNGTRPDLRRLYRSAWRNPKPSQKVKELDFISLGTGCHPFLLGVTVE